MNYVILKKFLTIGDCNNILDEISDNTIQYEEPKPLDLLDGDDMTNVWYKSKRSPGLSYLYSDNTYINYINKKIKKELSSITSIDFSGGINELCLPFCKYSDRGIIKAHRDIDKVNGLDKAVEYNVVCMLTQVGVDFENQDKTHFPLYDPLFINWNAVASKDGKEVDELKALYVNMKSNRFYPNLNKGDVIIFRNDNSIHGVDTVSVKEEQIGRITCGFRSK